MKRARPHKRRRKITVLTGKLPLVRRDIPNEPGEWVELRRLNWTQLGRAKRARTSAALAGMGEMPGNLMQAVLETRQKMADDQETDPLVKTYDAETLLNAGIVSWSYPAPVCAEAVADLDPSTADWAARELLRVADI